MTCRLFRCLLAVAALLSTGVGTAIAAGTGDDATTARVIVKVRADSALAQIAAAGRAAAPPRHATAFGARLGLALQDGRALGTRTQALRGSGVGSAELARRLAAQPDVEWAVVDHRRRAFGVTPNDPYYGPNQTAVTPAAGQWYLRAPDSTIVSATNAIGGWGKTTGSSTVIVAVLDTGVRFDHPDLAGKLFPGYDFVSQTSTAGDDDGRDSDASDPGDWSTSCNESTSSWHGTQVSGLIAAASDNGIGIAGSGRDVMVLPVRVLGKCGGYDSDILAGMRWAGGISSDPVTNSHPAKVLNMSLGSSGICEQSYIDVIADLNAADVSVVVAAGNENGVAVATPANCPGAIAVAGLRHAGSKVGYSNVGPEVALAAPAGNCVNLSGACLYPLMTTVNLGSTTPGANGYSDGSSGGASLGTSFSAPLVAGAAALMLSVDPTLKPAAIRDALRSTARAFPRTGAALCHAPTSTEQSECDCTATTCGAGMLDIGAAVAAVTPANGAPPTGAITLSSTAPMPGDTVTLGGAGSTAISGRSIVGYQWQIVSGGNRASFIGAANGQSASLKANAAGEVWVQLTVTDSEGAVNSKLRSLTVQGSGGSTGSGGGGGGGAFSALWLALLALAVFALRRAGRVLR